MQQSSVAVQAQSHQDLITQEEENHTTPPTPSDANVEEWRRMLEGGSLGPPPTLLPTTNNPTQGTVASPHHEKWGAPLTLEDVCTAQNGSQDLAAYPKIFDLLTTDTIPRAKDRLDNLALLAIKERLYLVVVVARTPCHIRVLWGI